MESIKRRHFIKQAGAGTAGGLRFVFGCAVTGLCGGRIFTVGAGPVLALGFGESDSACAREQDNGPAIAG